MQCKELVTWLKDWFYDKTEADNRYQQKSNGLVQNKTRVWSSSINLTYTLFVDEVNRHCVLAIGGSSISIASGSTNYEVSSFVPSAYRPKSNKYTRLGRSNNLLAYMWNNGTVGIANLTSATLSNQSLGGQMDWNY